MNHKWKTASLQDLVRYNRYLLLSVVILSGVCLMLSIATLAKEDKWVIFPSNDIKNSMEISSTKLYPSYLKEWARDIAGEIFTTSPDEVVAQHARIRAISSSNKQLDNFFAKQLAFVQGNNATSVFFTKKLQTAENGVIVTGTLHYWFTEVGEKISLEKSYLISYAVGNHGLVFLKNIEEVSIEKE